jgi:hypothetical protein
LEFIQTCLKLYKKLKERAAKGEIVIMKLEKQKLDFLNESHYIQDTLE